MRQVDVCFNEIGFQADGLLKFRHAVVILSAKLTDQTHVNMPEHVLRVGRQDYLELCERFVEMSELHQR